MSQGEAAALDIDDVKRKPAPITNTMIR
jgi:hypothetical protein